MNNFFDLDNASKREVIKQAAERLGMSPFAIEKDWWVQQTLAIIFEMEVGKSLVFKGGTSLSKGWQLIERFSEDVDLAIDRAYLGFEGTLGKEQRTKLRKAAHRFINNEFFDLLQQKFIEKGLKVKLSIEESKSSDQDPSLVYVEYPNVIDLPGYIAPRVQIEIGCRSLKEPFANARLTSFIDDVFSDKTFSQGAISIPTVLPERTLLEKMFLLHEEFQKPIEKIRVDRLSRHLYDVYMLLKAGIGTRAIADAILYETIVKHRYAFTKIQGVDYTLHHPQFLNPIPPIAFEKAWQRDYATMQEQMIYGKSPSYNEMIHEIESFLQQLKALNWELTFGFPTKK